MSKEKKHPLILVFYLDRALMEIPEIMEGYSSAVNTAISQREANAMAFFLPTDDKERIECINPVITTDKEKSKVLKLISDIEKSFDIGQGADDD